MDYNSKGRIDLHPSMYCGVWCGHSYFDKDKCDLKNAPRYIEKDLNDLQN